MCLLGVTSDCPRHNLGYWFWDAVYLAQLEFLRDRLGKAHLHPKATPARSWCCRDRRPAGVISSGTPASLPTGAAGGLHAPSPAEPSRAAKRLCQIPPPPQTLPGEPLGTPRPRGAGGAEPNGSTPPPGLRSAAGERRGAAPSLSPPSSSSSSAPPQGRAGGGGGRGWADERARSGAELAEVGAAGGRAPRGWGP